MPALLTCQRQEKRKQLPYLTQQQQPKSRAAPHMGDGSLCKTDFLPAAELNEVM